MFLERCFVMHMVETGDSKYRHFHALFKRFNDGVNYKLYGWNVDVMEFVISFAENQSLHRASVRAGIHYGTSAVHWANFIRDCCKMYIFEKMSITMLSGTIEIDESLFRNHLDR